MMRGSVVSIIMGGLTAWVLSACDPLVQIRGRVRVLPDERPLRIESGVLANARPLEGATVVNLCRQPERDAKATTDSRGNFEYTGIGYLYPQCKLQVEKAGYVAQRIPVRGLCVGTTCHFAGVFVELAPIEGTPPSARLGLPAEAPSSLGSGDQTVGVHIENHRDDVSLLRAVDRWGENRAYERVCRGSCDAKLPAGAPELAIQLDGNEPIPVPERIDFSPGDSFRVSYTDHSTRRFIGTGVGLLLFAAAIAVPIIRDDGGLLTLGAMGGLIGLGVVSSRAIGADDLARIERHPP